MGWVFDGYDIAPSFAPLPVVPDFVVFGLVTPESALRFIDHWDMVDGRAGASGADAIADVVLEHRLGAGSIWVISSLARAAQPSAGGGWRGPVNRSDVLLRASLICGAEVRAPAARITALQVRLAAGTIVEAEADVYGVGDHTIGLATVEGVEVGVVTPSRAGFDLDRLLFAPQHPIER